VNAYFLKRSGLEPADDIATSRILIPNMQRQQGIILDDHMIMHGQVSEENYLVYHISLAGVLVV